MYTKPGCPYCAKAREYYNTHSIPFEERNAQDNPIYRKEMLGFTGGDRTVPTIVEDGTLKQIGYPGTISVEARWKTSRGDELRGTDVLDRETEHHRALAFVRQQWDAAM